MTESRTTMKKITHKTQSEVFERLTRDRRGRLFRVRFTLIERGGIIRGKVLSCEKVLEIAGGATWQNIFLLPTLLSATKAHSLVSGAFRFRSPFSIFDFYFSQPIRGPARGTW